MFFEVDHKKENGASDGSRTHNLLHGKQMLYQLSYTRTRVRGDSMGKDLLGKWILAFKVVNDHSLAAGLKYFFHKFHVQGMCLVGVLRGSVFKNEVQRNLIRLIDHIPVTVSHTTAVVVQYTGAGLEILLGTGKELLSGVRDIGLGPENNYV